MQNKPSIAILAPPGNHFARQGVLGPPCHEYHRSSLRPMRQLSLNHGDVITLVEKAHERTSQFPSPGSRRSNSHNVLITLRVMDLWKAGGNWHRRPAVFLRGLSTEGITRSVMGTLGIGWKARGMASQACGFFCEVCPQGHHAERDGYFGGPVECTRKWHRRPAVFFARSVHRGHHAERDEYFIWHLTSSGAVRSHRRRWG